MDIQLANEAKIYLFMWSYTYGAGFVRTDMSECRLNVIIFWYILGKSLYKKNLIEIVRIIFLDEYVKLFGIFE